MNSARELYLTSPIASRWWGHYSATIWTGTLGRRLSNHNVFFESNRFSSSFFFANGPNNIQGSTIQPLKTLKPFERTSPPRKEPSNLWMLLFRLKKKTWESCFQKTLWLDNLLLRAQRVRSSRTVTPHSNALNQSAFLFRNPLSFLR